MEPNEGRDVSRPPNTLKTERMDEQHVAVEFSDATFRRFWGLVLLVRIVCAVFLAGKARLYWFLAHPYMTYYADLLGPGVGDRLKPFGVLFGLVALAHVHQSIQMIVISIRAKQLMFAWPVSKSEPRGSGTSRHPIRRSGNAAHRSSLMIRRLIHEHKVTRHLLQIYRSVWDKLFGRRGFFGVESEFFHARFLTREIVEIVSQTVQVYQSSKLISTPWINHLYVFFIVTNCWSTPLLSYWFGRYPAVERMLCLISDLLLDAGTSMIIPLIIFVPYYEKFVLEDYNFEIERLYDDVWFANMVKENQQIFALDTIDCLLKLVPHMSIFSCIGSVKALIKHRPPRRLSRSSRSRSTSKPGTIEGKITPDGSPLATISHEPKTVQAPTPSPPPSAPPSPAAPAPAAAAAAPAPESASVPVPAPEDDVSAPTPPLPFSRLQKLRDRMPPWLLKTLSWLQKRLVHTMFIIWGATILYLHVHATASSLSMNVPACKQPIRPWFAAKYACSVYFFNCYRNGTSTVTEADLTFLEEESVVALVFGHCPALVMPTQITKFHNLLGMDIYNSTIVEWSKEAAITNLSHPALAYIIFVRVNMTELPEGVLQPLPDSMADFEISVSNLTTLPDDLDQRWHPMAIFYFEHAQATTFPSALERLAVDDLSLIGNQLETLPDLSPDNIAYYSLALSFNPLKTLPETLGDPSTIGFLQIGDTFLSQFPSWMDQVEQTATKIYAYNTPFCNGKSAIEVDQKYHSDAVLTCQNDDDRRDGRYPLAVMAPKRRI